MQNKDQMQWEQKRDCLKQAILGTACKEGINPFVSNNLCHCRCAVEGHFYYRRACYTSSSSHLTHLHTIDPRLTLKGLGLLYTLNS